MNPEESKPTSQEPEVQQPVQAPEQKRAKKQPPKRLSKSRPVTVYLAVLFVVALLLLLLSFFMQQRNQQALEDLHASVSASQDITELQLANQQLEFQLEQAKKEQQDLEESKQALEGQVEDLEKQNQALEWLRQIEAATRTSYSKARSLVKAFDEAGLEQYLPVESVVEGETSPADTYRNIYAMLY